MLSDASFGQYYPVKSFIHSLDSRCKIILIIMTMILIFMAENFVAMGIIALFIGFVILLSRIPISSILKSIRPIIFLIIFTVVLNILFYQSGNIIFEFYFLKISDEALIFSARMTSRLILLFLIASMLTLTTTPIALTDGIESLLKPLRVIRFPVHEFALIMSIALRMIPILIEETDKIIRAQKARGADFESGNLINRARALLPILIPLLISAFERADALADAMDSRCYSGAKGRTKMKKLKYTYRDVIALLATICIFVIVIILT